MNDLEKVRKDGLALQYVKNQTLEICLTAINQNGWALEYVKDQTKEICLAAVRKRGYVKRGYVLQYVKDQTEEICLAAVENDCYSICFVQEPFKKACFSLIRRFEGTDLFDSLDEETVLEYINFIGKPLALTSPSNAIRALAKEVV